MAAISKQDREKLIDIKKDVRNSYEASQSNNERFNEFRKFVFESSLSPDDISFLTAIKKPQMEFNICEAYISRLLGEFSKQESSVMVGSDNEQSADPRTVQLVEAHLRHLLLDSKKHNVRWEMMKDLYSGGFSVAKMLTRYAHPMSFDQIILYNRADDPTMCGFDQLAKEAHKGDGRYCFEIFPRELEEFKREFPKANYKDLTFYKEKMITKSADNNFAGYNWSYRNGDEKIVVVCEYYLKKFKHIKIVQMMDGKVIPLDVYQEREQQWYDGGNIAQFPAFNGKPRWTDIETIMRYRANEIEILQVEETDFSMFPLIYFDGNSIKLRDGNGGGASYVVTKPYVYNGKDTQKLKNFAGITVANEIENIVQSKFIVAKEALPKEQDWLDAYRDNQLPSNMIFNAFNENDPDQPIPNPIREIQRMPAPPELLSAFNTTDSLMQNILGSYDAALGINNNQLSGAAIREGATQSNAAAMPYMVGFLQGLTRVAEFYIDTFPKYYKTPRTIPVRGIDGKSDYIRINEEGAPNMFYDANVFNVKVEAGPSFEVQQNIAFDQLISLMRISASFNEFMNDRGLSVLLDNIKIRGIDQLKMMVKEWQQELRKRKELLMQEQKKNIENNPAVMKNKIEMAKINQNQQEMESKQMIHQAQFQLDIEELKNERMKILANMHADQENSRTQRIKAETERFGKSVDLAIKKKDMHHKHLKESIQLHHNVHARNRELEMNDYMISRPNQ